jgi:hypothetical protein
MRRKKPILGQRARHAFLEALQASLWNRPPLPILFDGLSREDWKGIFQLSFHQTVEGHIADAVRTLPSEFLPPHDIMLKWAVRLQRIEDRDAQMRKVISYLGWFFRENEIRAVLQKGHGVSLYYEKPEIRHGGDIDWFFPLREGYQRANFLMDSPVHSFRLTHGQSASYNFEGIEIEHHQKLVQLRNPFITSYVRNLVDELGRENLKVSFEGEAIEIPSPMLNSIQVNAHILKHQVTYGIGLRQLCDAARLYHSFEGSLDGPLLRDIYRRMGMLKWVHSFHRVLTDLIGLREDKLPFAIEGRQDVQWMMDYIMRTGNFGFYDPDNPDIQNPGGRVNRAERLLENFRRFYPLAPVETACFPFVHLFSKVHQ